ncbi:MAG: hypothetical protein E7355_00725 [Clostridiales bacterium]|nr:hypothetical protein [Clostridiales bacterium]
MRKRFKWKLIAFLAVVASLLLLVGCGPKTLDEHRAEHNLDVSVTYCLENPAEFGKNTGKTKQTLYYTNGSKALNLTPDKPKINAIDMPIRGGYDFIGWFEAESGPDENGNVVLKEEPFDFSQQLSNVDIVLYAKWEREISVYVHLVCDEITADAPFIIEEKKEDKVIQNGEVLKIHSFDSEGEFEADEDDMPTATGYTGFAYYMDAECTTEVEWPLVKTDANTDIYLKYIKGDWQILRKATDIQTMLSFKDTRQYYLANDIDCTNVTMTATSNFYANFQGNGYTIKNLTINGGKLSTNSGKSAFLGEISKDAKIENVIFENFTFKFEALENSYVEAYIFSSSIADGAKLNNVRFKGTVTLDITLNDNAKVNNMLKFDEWHKEHVFFGTGETDQENWDNGLDVTLDQNASLVVLKNGQQL